MLEALVFDDDDDDDDEDEVVEEEEDDVAPAVAELGLNVNLKVAL